MRSLLYLVVGTGLTVAGFTSGTFSTLVDYGTVGWQRASTWVEENIPLEDELAVLELNVKKLDAEIDSNAKLVASFEVELEQSQRSLEKGEAVQKELGTGLDALGQKYVTMIDGSHREQVSQTLRRGTEHFKIRAQTLTAQRDAITRKQESLDKLKAGFEQQKHDRGLMKAEVERLRAEYTAMKVKGQLSEPALLGTTSTKVQELKQRIEKKLLTQQKLHEMSSGDISSEIAKLNNESSVFDLAELQSALQSINP